MHCMDWSRWGWRRGRAPGAAWPHRLHHPRPPHPIPALGSGDGGGGRKCLNTSTHSERVATFQSHACVWKYTGTGQIHKDRSSAVTGHNIRVRLGSEEVNIAARHYGRKARWGYTHTNNWHNATTDTHTDPLSTATTTHYLLMCSRHHSIDCTNRFVSNLDNYQTFIYVSCRCQVITSAISHTATRYFLEGS